MSAPFADPRAHLRCQVGKPATNVCGTTAALGRAMGWGNDWLLVMDAGMALQKATRASIEGAGYDVHTAFSIPDALRVIGARGAPKTIICLDNDWTEIEGLVWTPGIPACRIVLVSHSRALRVLLAEAGLSWTVLRAPLDPSELLGILGHPRDASPCRFVP